MRFAAAIAAIVTIGVVLGARAEAPPAKPPAAMSTKEIEIRKLMEITGQGQLGLQVIGQLLDGFRQAFPKAPEALWTDFKNSLKPDEMTALLVPIYDKHFTEDDIKQLNAFYQTPLGQKLLNELPAVTQASMVAGQDWGTKLGDKLMKQLEAKGYKLRVPN